MRASLRTIAAELGHHIWRTVPTLMTNTHSRNGRAGRTVFPALGTVRGISGSATRIKVSFICLGRMWWNGFLGPGWDGGVRLLL